MARATNFGDSTYEERAELIREALVDVPARNAAALARLHEDIVRMCAEVLARLAR